MVVRQWTAVCRFLPNRTQLNQSVCRFCHIPVCYCASLYNVTRSPSTVNKEKNLKDQRDSLRVDTRETQHHAFKVSEDGVYPKTRLDGSLFSLKRLESKRLTTEVRKLFFSGDAVL